MYGFAGRSFNFIGDPGKIYNIISTQNMQVGLQPPGTYRRPAVWIAMHSLAFAGPHEGKQTLHVTGSHSAEVDVHCRSCACAVGAHLGSTMQVSMKLRLAQMWDHNGTNMEALGFMYRDYQVLISLDANDDLKGAH